MNETIIIENASNIAIKGATKVVTATQNQAVVETGGNSIVITGSNLEVKKLDLDNAEVCFTGKITNIKYGSLNAAKQPLLKRLFK